MADPLIIGVHLRPPRIRGMRKENGDDGKKIYIRIKRPRAAS